MNTDCVPGIFTEIPSFNLLTILSVLSESFLFCAQEIETQKAALSDRKIRKRGFKT